MAGIWGRLEDPWLWPKLYADTKPNQIAEEGPLWRSPAVLDPDHYPGRGLACLGRAQGATQDLGVRRSTLAMQRHVSLLYTWHAAICPAQSDDIFNAGAPLETN